MILIQPQYLPALAQSRLLRQQLAAACERGAGPGRPTPPAQVPKGKRRSSSSSLKPAPLR
jgi:hypothetical protein